MFPRDELLSFMDLLDLDEEVIDSRLETIMGRSNFTNKHLTNAIHLLRYKHLINIQEDSECDNDREYLFVSKLISNLQEDNVDNICKIVNIVISLNPNTLVSKSEHLIQQILCNIEIPLQVSNMPSNSDEDKFSAVLLNLKICNSILGSVVSNDQVLSLPFLDVPLENILFSNQEKLNGLFLTNTVPLLFKGIYGYNILDRIWKCIILLKDKTEIALKTLACLSDYYLPITENNVIALKSDIVFKDPFWQIVLKGLMSEVSEITNRRMSTYLMKRALDYLICRKSDVNAKLNGRTIFKWEEKAKKKLKIMWDNFFIVLDSLEEKQSNIILPSLRLLDNLKDIPSCWLNCIFNLGLKHDNTQVRLKCIDFRLKVKISEDSEALIFLEALNDTYLFDELTDYNLLKDKLSTVFSDVKILMFILKTMPQIKWSPVPLFHLSEVLAVIRKDLLNTCDQSEISQTILNILKIPCNNILIRKAVHVNISYLIGNCCRGFHWKVYLDLYRHFGFNSHTEESRNNNPLILYIKENALIEPEAIPVLFKLMMNSEKNINFGLFYIETHPVEVTELLTCINRMIINIQDTNQRQFADKLICFNDVVSLTNIFSKTTKRNNAVIENINLVSATAYKTILEYLICLLQNDVNLSTDEIDLLFLGLKNMISTLSDYNAIETVLLVYKSCILMLEDRNVKIETKILSVHIVSVLLASPLMIDYHKHEILKIDRFLSLCNRIGNEDLCIRENNGRLKNILYEKYCEILYNMIKANETIVKVNTKQFLNYIDNAAECGGFGCLIWILKIMKLVMPILLEPENNFEIGSFLNRMWKEVEELKSNNQYPTCISEFVNIITDDCLLGKPVYNNIILSYCYKIIEYGPVKNTPLFFLVSQINKKHIAKYNQMVYALCEIILFSPIPRKDQRITDNLSIDILNQIKYGTEKHDLDIHFNFHIQYLSYCVLSKIDNRDVLNVITTFITKKIDSMFANKKRYHGNSQSHRTLLTALQTLLLILLKSRDVDMDKIANWCMELLGSFPHQPSVRICLEWYTALYFCFKEMKITNEMVEQLKTKNISLPSQFIILHWITTFKIKHGSIKDEEYEFAMDTLLCHTMGQIFSLRLHAQYLATKLFDLNFAKKSNKYDFTIKVIRRTFKDSAGDKALCKLQRDYFANEFDLVIDFIPSFVYYFLPRYCEMYINEKTDKRFIQRILQEIDDNSFAKVSKSVFKTEWTKYQKRHEKIYDMFVADVKGACEDSEVTGTIQKKYVPWKNMSDVNMYEVKDRKANKGELIVVASLIDKLPNLGGLARTSEVFGIKTYVLDSLRHLQDKQFQGLSVSAERWIDVEEVRPHALNEYITKKKAEGYSVVAAEQTSTSCQLQSFKFPAKTLLLLGHEKEGVPCDLLPLMDHCVEIPQQGVIRSLNVHVTAAIFVWEYTRQIML